LRRQADFFSCQGKNFYVLMYVDFGRIPARPERSERRNRALRGSALSRREAASGIYRRRIAERILSLSRLTFRLVRTFFGGPDKGFGVASYRKYAARAGNPCRSKDAACAAIRKRECSDRRSARSIVAAGSPRRPANPAFSPCEPPQPLSAPHHDNIPGDRSLLPHPSLS
jgi:hypothetical protein